MGNRAHFKISLALATFWLIFVFGLPVKNFWFLWLLAICVFAGTANAQPLHTPQPGSAERQAICDAARAHLFARYITRQVPGPVVFKIDHIRVQGAYCYFQAVPVFKNGSYVAPDYMPDVALDFCLEKKSGAWKVIVDLSRTDVPDAAEAAAIKRGLPPDFPLSVFSSTWRDLLAK